MTSPALAPFGFTAGTAIKGILGGMAFGVKTIVLPVIGIWVIGDGLLWLATGEIKEIKISQENPQWFTTRTANQNGSNSELNGTIFFYDQDGNDYKPRTNLVLKTFIYPNLVNKARKAQMTDVTIRAYVMRNWIGQRCIGRIEFFEEEAPATTETEARKIEVQQMPLLNCIDAKPQKPRINLNKKTINA